MRGVLPPSWRRWRVVVAVSVLGHALALLLLDHGLHSAPTAPASPWLRAELAPTASPPAARPAPSHSPAHPPTARAPRLPVPDTSVAPAAAIEAIDTAGAQIAVSPPPPAPTSPTSPTEANAERADAAPPPVSQETSDANLPLIDPPPAGTLRFKAYALEGERQYYGSGELRWLPDDGRYRIEQTLGLDLIFTSIQLQQSVSEGRMHDRGLEPQRYTESRRGKTAVATNFNRDSRQSITFSASERVIPIEAGAQDRASVLLNLASHVRASNGAPPARYEVLLAGVRDAEHWVFVLQGEETITTPQGDLATLHYVRLPTGGSRERQVDVWFAAALDGMPARIRYTERNGNLLELNTQQFARAAAAP